MAIGGLGDAYINIHANTDPFNRELREEEARGDANKILDDIGTGWGDHISQATTKEIHRHGPDFAHAVEDSVAHETIHVRSKVDYYNVRDNKGRFTKKIATDLEQDIENAFDSATKPGGPFDKIGRGISDAIGAGFGVSGKSPLILVLAPVVGAIAGLIVGLIELINLAAGLFTTLPGLITGIGLQVATLMFAFHGLHKAITDAFAAKNAKELQAAIAGLSPEAQKFVKSLLPIRDLFHAIQQTAQNNFFKSFGNTLSVVVKELGPTFFQGIARMATVLGDLFAGIGKVFAGPESKRFLSEVFARTIVWLQQFTPAFLHFLDAFIKLSTQALPFLTTVGAFLANNLDAFATFLDSVTKGDTFQNWLASLTPILDGLGSLVVEFTKFIAALLTSTNKAGGATILSTLADALEKLAFFLASPAGVKGLEGVIDLANLSIQALTGLITIILLLAAAIDLAGESIKAFFTWLGTVIEGFVHWLEHIWDGLWKRTSSTFQSIQDKIGDVVSWIGDHIHQAVGFVESLPEKILGAVENFGTLLYNAGKNLITGLINGIKNSIPGLSGLLDWVTAHIPSWKGPEDKDRHILEPAGRAVMAGFVTGLNAGASEVRDALIGLTNSMGQTTTTNTHSVNFGPGAIQINFAGTPTQAQAYEAGQAVGAGINSQMEIRDVSLGVRRM